MSQEATGLTLRLGFPIDIPGNYSVHVWTQDPLNNGTGQFSVAVRTVVDQKPYATAGLASVIVALTAICLLGVVAGIFVFRSTRRRRTPHLPREKFADQDDSKHEQKDHTRLIPERGPPSAME